MKPDQTVPICPICSERIEEGQKSCPNCGSGTGVVEQDLPEPVAVTTSRPVQLVLAGVVLLIVLAGVAFVIRLLFFT